MTAVRITLFIVDLFVALTAIGGGIATATGLERNNFPTEWLKDTPFKDFLIPGFLLAVIVGGSSAVAAFATVRGSDVGAAVSALAGALLVGWIIGEVLILNQPGWTKTEAFYLLIGILMILLSAVLWFR